MTLSCFVDFKDLPVPMPDPKNSQDRLWNTVLGYLAEKGCTFPKNAGKGPSLLLSRLCDMLFYVDGQHSKIESAISQEKEIPEGFKTKFSSINCPEKA